MSKFEMTAAWDDSVILLRSHIALTGTIAAVFLFLPTLAVSWFGPVPVEPAANASMQQVQAALMESGRILIPYQLLLSLFAAIGGVGIMRLWLSRAGTSVGDALVFALRMIPTMIGVQLLLGVALGVAALIVILPGAVLGAMLGDPGRVLLLVMLVLLFVGLCAYVWGRLALVSAIIADRSEANPLTAIRESMALTTGNGWRLFGFLFLVTLVVVIAVMMVSGGFVALESMSGMSGGPGSVRLLSGFAEAVVGALGGLVTTAVTTAAYRQLAAPERGDVFS